MNSFNHYAFGSVAQWLYEYVAGIRPLPEGAGFRRFRLEPMPNSLLAHAEASLQSPQGTISSRWALVGEKLQLTFEVPFGACAEIVLPDAGGAAVLENGEPLPLTEAPLVRGSGRWTYSYVPNGATIHRRFPASSVRPIELLTPAMASCTPKWIVFTAPQMDMHSIRPERMVSCIRMTSVWFR